MMQVARTRDWLSTQSGQEILMMNLERGTYVGLNPVAARIWELIETPCTIDALCDRLVEEFEVSPEVCRGETETVCRELARLGAVTIDHRAE